MTIAENYWTVGVQLDDLQAKYDQLLQKHERTTNGLQRVARVERQRAKIAKVTTLRQSNQQRELPGGDWDKLGRCALVDRALDYKMVTVELGPAIPGCDHSRVSQTRRDS